MERSMRFIEKINIIDWLIAAGCGLGALYYMAAGNDTVAMWLAMGAFISALAAYFKPAKRLALRVQEKHMRSARR